MLSTQANWCLSQLTGRFLRKLSWVSLRLEIAFERVGMTFVWLAVIGVLVVVELLTYGLYFAALAVAAIVPLILSLLGFELWVQALGFLGAAVAALVYIRPLIKKWQGEKPERLTNTQSLIGKEALALTEITEHVARPRFGEKFGPQESERACAPKEQN